VTKQKVESRKQKVPQLPPGCGYSGHDFGASYPDSQCYGGRLYDLDNCDDHGNLYEPSDYIPCPDCQHEAWRERYRDEIEESGYTAAENGDARESCPFPEKAKRYPQDGQWLKECWLRGYDLQKKGDA
jgi:hypothetical protein